LAQINVTGVPPQGGAQASRYQEAFEQARARYSDQFDQLQKRSQDPLSLSKFASLDRSIDRFDATIRRFEQKFGGTSAGFEQRISGLRQGMGTPDAAYRVANTLRLEAVSKRHRKGLKTEWPSESRS
jgi:hypothetical protein